MPSENMTLKKSNPKKKAAKKALLQVGGNTNLMKYLLSSDPYFASLVDPFEVRGVKIPDLVSLPSNCFSIVQRTTLTANANGVCGLTYGLSQLGGGVIATGSLIPMNFNSATYDWIVGCKLGTAATSTDLFVGGSAVGQATAFKYPSGIWDSTSGIVPSYYSGARLVSAGFVINYTGQPLNAQGRIVCVSAPRKTFRSATQSGAGFSIDTLLGHPSAKIGFVNQLKGMTVVYQPQDPVSFTYATDLGYAFSSADAANVYSNNEEWLGSEIFMIIDGAVASTSAFQVTAVLNFEGTPKKNAYTLVGAGSPSPIDSMAIENAMRAIQELDPVTVGTSKQDNSMVLSNRELNRPMAVNSSPMGMGESLRHEKPHAKQRKTTIERVVDFVGGAVKSPIVQDIGIPLVKSALAALF